MSYYTTKEAIKEAKYQKDLKEYQAIDAREYLKELKWEYYLEKQSHKVMTIEEKVEALNLGADKYAKKIGKARYQKDSATEFKVRCEAIKEGISDEILENGRKINDATYHRNIRLKNRLESMFDRGDCYFMTLTLDDDKLKEKGIDLGNLSDKDYKYLRKEVTRYLGGLGAYVANYDYGASHDRLHFHAVVQSNVSIKLGCENDWYKHLGAIYVEKIRKGTNDSKRLSKYINKLTNHAIKATTKASKLIYSKGF